MKLFYWTEHDYDICSHHAAYAEDLETAKELVVEGIRKSWELGPDEEDPTWLAQHCEQEIKEFLTDEKWQFEVFDVPGPDAPESKSLF